MAGGQKDLIHNRDIRWRRGHILASRGKFHCGDWFHLLCLRARRGRYHECTDLSTRFAVDMLLNEPLDTLNGYLVYPNPVGVHTFSGDNGLYLENFCKVYPDSPYCKIDENEDILE